MGAPGNGFQVSAHVTCWLLSIFADVCCDDKMGTGTVRSWACDTHQRIHPVNDATRPKSHHRFLQFPHELAIMVLLFVVICTDSDVSCCSVLPVDELRPDGSAIDDGNLVAGDGWADLAC